MRKDNSTLLKKLKQYSALSGTMLAATGMANAQINYTDLDPDVTLLSSNGDFLEIDLNNDGQSDFVFTAGSATFTGGTTAKFINAVMQPYYTTNLNGFVGTIGTLAAGIYFGYPSALSAGVTIDGNQDFFELGDLVYNSQFFLPGLLTVYNGASSFGNWTGGVVDQYVGIKFSPDGAEIHYGWIRCDVASDGTSITIKDYAWNETAHEGIDAGDAGDIGFGDINNTDNFTVFGYEGVVNIIVKDGNMQDVMVTITNMLGETVLTQSLNTSITRVNLSDYSKGIYLVKVERGNEHFTKKVSFR